MRKKIEVLKDTLDGIDADSKRLTINDMYRKWVVLKKGLKSNTSENYKYMYEMYAYPVFGNLKNCRLEKIRR